MIDHKSVNTSYCAQRGQVLVLGMILVSLALLAFSRYFYTGQVVAARIRQDHALDAASYSGALVQARALNMLAYMNRAQIGHQVAMAHLVTLASWAHLAGTEAQQLSRGNPPAHLISMLFGSEHGAAYMAAAQASGFNAMARHGGELGSAYANHDRVMTHVLAALQQHVVDAVPDARYQAMLSIIKHNLGAFPDKADDTLAFNLTLHGDQWPGFLQRHAGQTLRPFVLQSAQIFSFLAPRNQTARNSWVVDGRCPSRRHELRRRGTTELDSSGRWQSIDTESFHALRSNRWIGCYFREYAMGWGWIPSSTAQGLGDPHVDNPPEDFSSQDFWRWVRESTDWDISSGSANALANSKASLQRQRWQGGGLRSYVDVRDGDVGNVGFTAHLSYPGPQGLSITTQSAAEAFFARPVPRPDARTETANLFRPYWQARLSSNAVSTPQLQGTP